MTSHDELQAALERADKLIEVMAPHIHLEVDLRLLNMAALLSEHSAFMQRFRASPNPPPQPQVYYRGATTVCPACMASNWLVGRKSAECAACHHALPLAPRTHGNY